MTYEIAWTHEVGPARPDAFERAYGVDGDWARLFRRDEGFVEVVLLDADVSGRGTALGEFVRR